MPRNRLTIDAPPSEVFAVLADAASYPHWVVGCDDIRAVEGNWPAPGSKFFHTVGVGPLKTRDNTKALEVEPGRRLVLEARARPAGIAEVIFTLTPSADGAATDVEIEEYPVRGIAKVIDNPLQRGLIKLRNVETLRRLAKQVAQRRREPTPTPTPATPLSGTNGGHIRAARAGKRMPAGPGPTRRTLLSHSFAALTGLYCAKARGRRGQTGLESDR